MPSVPGCRVLFVSILIVIRQGGDLRQTLELALDQALRFCGLHLPFPGWSRICSACKCQGYVGEQLDCGQWTCPRGSGGKAG